MKKVLIVGSGGREHALAWKLHTEGSIEQLYLAPGNGGTASIAENLPIKPTDFQALEQACQDHQIDLLIVGPEQPLAMGIRDYFKENSEVPVLGPDKAAAQLESSKAWAKAFMDKYQIPTARYASFSQDQTEEAKNFLDTLEAPFVLKADGLAAGKGVLIVEDRAQAKAELEEMLGGKFGQASQQVVIEEFLEGIEVSFFVITDGKEYVLLPSAKDYKRVGEGGQGPNTGGMGTVSPVPFVSEALEQKVRERIITPTIAGLEKEGVDYCGFIFFGLMVCKEEPYVIEYNVRMGDPETQVIMPRIQTPLAPLFLQAARGQLQATELRISPQSALCVVKASGGYPGSYEKGHAIQLPAKLQDWEQIFHAGTQIKGDKLLTSGGRVLASVAMGQDLAEARQRAYQLDKQIVFAGAFTRSDIGLDIMDTQP